MSNARKRRSAGTDWRLLVHVYNGPNSMYGTAHNVKSDPRMGLLATSPDPVDSDDEKTIVLPDTEFDELVVGRWIHIEQMDDGVWWMNIAGVTVHVKADRNGRPQSVRVDGPLDYDEPVEGCKYSLDWDGFMVTDHVYPPERPEVPAPNPSKE